MHIRGVEYSSVHVREVEYSSVHVRGVESQCDNLVLVCMVVISNMHMNLACSEKVNIMKLEY